MPGPLNPDPATTNVVARERQCRAEVPGSHARECIREQGHPGRHRSSVKCTRCHSRNARTPRGGATFAVGSPSLCHSCARAAARVRIWER